MFLIVDDKSIEVDTRGIELNEGDHVFYNEWIYEVTGKRYFLRDAHPMERPEHPHLELEVYATELP